MNNYAAMTKALLSLAILVALAVAVTSALLLRPYSRDYEYAQLKSCFVASEPKFDCLDSTLRSILHHESPAKAMKTINEQFPLGECHTAGHVIGQIIYDDVHSIDAAIAECPVTCSTSCIHGASGEALREATGIGKKFGDAHPSLDLIKSEGKKLCGFRDACHAIGHVLFQYYQNLDMALKGCDDFGATCYRGVFMEDFFLQMPDSDTVRTDRPDDPNDILYPCDTLEERYRQACYHFLFFNQNHFFDDAMIIDREKRQDMRFAACKSIRSPSDRISCFEGFGYWFTTLDKQFSSDVAREYCAKAPDLSSRAACSFGLGNALGAFNRELEAYGVCAHMEGLMKRACYQGYFDGDVQRGMAIRDDYCSGAEDPMCRSVLKEYLENPDDLEFPLDLGIPAKGR